jgi:multidrug efflux system membrane fusion protein
MKYLVRFNRRGVTAITFVGLVVLAFLLRHSLFSGTQPSKRTQQAAPAPVVTRIADIERVPVYLTAIGNVSPVYSVLVKVRVDGQLDRVQFKEGQNVEAGDLLAQIDPRALQAQLAQFVAQKARDEAQLSNGLLDLERYTTLLQQDSVAKQQFDTQRATVDQLKATVKLDQAQIDNARVQLAYTTIRAPITGRTGVRLVDPGNIVHASDSSGIVTINQVDPIHVLFTLPEEQFQNVNQAKRSSAKPLLVKAYARTGTALLGTGTLTLINNQIDVATGTFLAKAVFANPSQLLWPGQYVNVRLLVRELENAITVPEAAIQRGPNGLYVYVVNPDSTVASQPVTLGFVQDGKAVIERGVAPGTRVVIEGQYKLKPGIKVVEPSATEKPARPEESDRARAAPGMG